MATITTSWKSKVSFHDLPVETQKHIFRYVRNKELLSLLCVSRHFFALASSEIYRELDFNFTSSDAAAIGSPTSRVASALQAIVASDHDYGQYIKDFRLGLSEDFTSNALMMHRVLWDSAGDPSKLLNILVLLLVKKANIMETFQWDAPIELSNSVYEALHKTSSLRHLRIRLDVSAPMKTTINQVYPSPPQVGNPHTPSSHHLPPLYHVTPTSSAQGAASAARLKKLSKKKAGGYDYWINGRVFSGFKTLHSLTVLGISNSECLGEIAGGLKASSNTLRSLSLSLAYDLALKARKPLVSNPAPNDTSDTEPDGEDEEDPMDMPELNTAGPQPPAPNEADIRQEKLIQETFLARIFNLEAVVGEGKRLERSLTRKAGKHVTEPLVEDDTSLSHELEQIMKGFADALPAEISKETYLRTVGLMMKAAFDKFLGAAQKQVTETLTEIAKDELLAKLNLPMTEVDPLNGGPSSSSKPLVDPSTQWSPLSYDSESTTSFPAGKFVVKSLTEKATFSDLNSFAGMFELANHTQQQIVNKYLGNNLNDSLGSKSGPPASQNSAENTTQEIQNIKALNIVHDPSDDEGNSLQRSASQGEQASLSTRELSTVVDEDLIDIDMEHPDENTVEPGPDQEIIPEPEEKDRSPRKRARFTSPDSAKPPNSDQMLPATSSSEPRRVGPRKGFFSARKRSDDMIHEYIRANHGFQLEELSLHLIPLKASILARALDLNVLRRITLLNVGPQEPFWLLLMRLQGHSANISFQSIHTDHVSMAFLHFLKTFVGLEDLFMMQQSVKKDVDTFAAKVDANITWIRKLALRQHIRSLKRLLIKNEHDDTWDLDRKTTFFLSSRGEGLRELGICLNLEVFHTFLQQLPGLKNLTAVHFIFLRTRDRSPSLTHYLDFVVDTISHLPQHKIGFVAAETTLICLERNSKFVKGWLGVQKEVDSKAKGKQPEKSTTNAQGNGKVKAMMLEGSTTEDDQDTSDSETLDSVAEKNDIRTGIAIHMDFFHVPEVKIFDKVIRTGRL